MLINQSIISGHFGAIKFPFTILHPYFMAEIAEILQKICPACKSIRQELRVKVWYLLFLQHSNSLSGFVITQTWFQTMSFCIEFHIINFPFYLEMLKLYGDLSGFYLSFQNISQVLSYMRFSSTIRHPLKKYACLSTMVPVVFAPNCPKK